MRQRFAVPRALVRLHRDERGLVIGFFVRIFVVMVLVGLCVEEGGQVVVAQVKAEGAARMAAQAAADAYVKTHDKRRLEEAASEAAREKDEGASVTEVRILADGRATVTVQEHAHTLLVSRIWFLRKYGVQTSQKTEGRST